jgi:hypothetical protein
VFRRTFVPQTQVVTESAQGQELAAAWGVAHNANSNTAASVGDTARGEHASAERDVHLGKHSATKCAVLCVIVYAQQA